MLGIAVIGCGTVGGATAKLLVDEAERIRDRTGKQLVLKYVVDLNFEHAKKIGLDPKYYETDYQKALADDSVGLVVELVGGLTIARTIIERALKAKKHVVTANKALLAHYGPELFALARQNGVSLGFEASCGGGIPVIKAITDGLQANRAEAMYGILNGTCNLVLTEMTEKGRSYGDVLSQAQKKGLAEADPTLDVSGKDTAHKLTILASLVFGCRVSLESFTVKGIDTLDLFDVRMGQSMGYVIKLLAIAQKEGDALALRVAPVFIDRSHPLARVSGSFNAVSLYGHAVGHTMYYGRGAGAMPTGSAVVQDILDAALGLSGILFGSLKIWPDITQPAKLLADAQVMSRYYIRIMTDDRPGVIARIAACLSEHHISITSLHQDEAWRDGDVIPVAITTHRASRGDVLAAVETIGKLPEIKQPVVCLEILDEHKESVE